MGNQVIRVKRAVDDRKGYLGGSSWGAALGVSTYKTPKEVFKEYFYGEKKEVSEETQRIFDMGHALEDFVASVTERFYGVKLKKTPYLYLCPEDRRLGCHPDRLVVDNPELAVEIKSSSVYDNGRWGQEDTDEIPYDYLMQCYSYFACIPSLNTVWLMRFSNNRLTRYIVRKNDELLAQIIEQLRATLDDWDEGNAPETTDLSEAMSEALLHEGEVVATEDIVNLFDKYQEAKEQSEKLDKDMDSIKLEVLSFMKAKEGTAVVDGKGAKLFSVYTTTRNTFDSKAFLKEHPEYSEGFTKTSTSQAMRVNTRRR